MGPAGFTKTEVKNFAKGTFSDSDRLTGKYTSSFLGIQRTYNASDKDARLKSLYEMGSTVNGKSGYDKLDISHKNYGRGKYADKCGADLVISGHLADVSDITGEQI